MKYAMLLSLIIICVSCLPKEPEKKVVAPEKKEVVTEEKVAQEPLLTGKITTIADGFDAGKVNLWESNLNKDKITGVVHKNEKVTILKDADPYFLVETDDGRKGYLLKDWVILDK